MASETGAFTSSVLSSEFKRYLERLPLTVERRLGADSFFLCHATPSDPLFGYLDKDAPEWTSEVLSTEARTVVTGHTHIPFIRSFLNQTLINPGSIGQPKTGTPDACYAIWEDGVVALQRYSYPVGETELLIKKMPISDKVKTSLIHALKTGGQIIKGAE
jgi:protein phosphatase